MNAEGSGENRIAKYLGYLGHVGTLYKPAARAKHDYENVFLKGMKQIGQKLPIPLSEASLLVLGCGYNYPEVILYSGCCKHVVGLDIISAFFRDGVWRTLRDNRTREGLGSSLLRTGFERLESRGYYKHLEQLSGKPVQLNDYTLVSYDGRNIPFEAEEFDIVTSNAVLEHVEDLNIAMSEIHRVTKRGGVSYHLWHNYYSLSGGHAQEYYYRKHPWAHLRGLYAHPSLAKYTPEDVAGTFSRYFTDVELYPTDKNHRKKGLDADFQYEGQDLLTEDLRKALQGFPVELLLTRAYLITGRKGS